MQRTSFAKLGTAAVGMVAAGAALIGVAAPSQAGPIVSQVPYGIYTVAGNGLGPTGAEPEHVPATQSPMAWSSGLTYDHAGNMYIAETWGCRLRKVDTQHKITTYTTFPGAPPAGGFGCAPGGVAVDANDHVYATLPFAGLVVRVESNGSLTKVAGGGASTASSTSALDKKLAFPGGLTFAPDGNLYFADQTNNQIYAVAGGQPNGALTTVAGTDTKGYNGDGIAASGAELNEPFSVAAESDGSLLVGDIGNCRVRHVTPGGTISTFAGTGTCGFSGDNGPATAAQITDALGIAINQYGNVYFSDKTNERIREVSASGKIYTAAGNGTAGYNGEGVAPTSSELNWPHGVAFAPTTGYVTFVDASNARVRQIRPQTLVVTGGGLPIQLGGN